MALQKLLFAGILLSSLAFLGNAAGLDAPAVSAKHSARRLLQSGSPALFPAASSPQPSSGFVYSTGGTYPIVPALFVFGDSLVDVGNGVQLGDSVYGSYPYGVTPGNRLNVTGRVSNGLNIPDYVTEFLGLPLLNPSLLPNATFYNGANFASSGSGALNTTGTPGQVLTLYNQTQLFLGFERQSAAYWANPSAINGTVPLYPQPSSFGSALYLIITGGNDLRAFNGSASQFPAFAGQVLASVNSTILTLYGAGARNFLISNIPQAACTPAARNVTVNHTCNAPLAAAIQQFNLGYAQLVNGLRAGLPGSMFLLFDAFQMGQDATTYPSAFGFDVVDRACCGSGPAPGVNTLCGYPGSSVCANPNGYLFWDILHPTTTAASVFAREMFGGKTYIKPSNILQAFALPNLTRP